MNYVSTRGKAPILGFDDVLLAGLARVRSEFSAEPNAAAQFLAVGESPPDAKLAAIDHAAWAAICLAIMNLDETLTKE